MQPSKSRRRLARVGALLCVALGVSLVHGAAHNSPGRMPDWFGQWEYVDAQPDATGGMQQSLAEVMKSIRKDIPPAPLRPNVKAIISIAQAEVARGAADPNGPAADPLLKASCTWGMPALMVFSPLMFEILPTPEETVMVFSGRESRHIYTDGRVHTPAEDLWPTAWGDSIGHWQGQTLIIDTISVKNPFALPDAMPIPMLRGLAPLFVFGGNANDLTILAFISPQAHFREQIRMIDHDHLENVLTIEDPAMLTAPWTMRRVYERVTRIHRMVHEDCEGEERNPVVNGKYTLTAPPAAPSAPTLPSAPAR